MVIWVPRLFVWLWVCCCFRPEMLNNGCYACSSGVSGAKVSTSKLLGILPPFCVSVYIAFVQYMEGGNINILYKARKLCARICSGSFQSESVRRTSASLRRVCIHSKCPLQNYGTSSVFTPSYRPPSWMATMPLPSLPCKHFVKSCHMFMTHQQPGGWVWAHLSQSKLLPLFYASPIFQFLDFNQPTAFTSCLIPCKYPLRRSNMKYGRLWFIYSFYSCLIWKGGFHVPIPNSGPKQF